MERGSIFKDDAAFETRLILDESELEKTVKALKDLKLRIVLTSGSFDLPHIGHMRYLREARLKGDVLIVGVDSDEKVRSRKGKLRPVLPDRERAEMVAHSRYVDIVTIKSDSQDKWSLIKLVSPDVLVISERTGYDAETQTELNKYCGAIVNLESQAKSSTSAGIRRLQLETILPALAQIRGVIDKVEKEMTGEPAHD